MSVDVSLWLSHGKWELTSYEENAFLHLRMKGEASRLTIFCKSQSAALALAITIEETATSCVREHIPANVDAATAVEASAGPPHPIEPRSEAGEDYLARIQREDQPAPDEHTNVVEHPPLEGTLALAPQIEDDPRYVLPTHALDRRDNRRDNSDSNAMEVDDDMPF